MQHCVCADIAAFGSAHPPHGHHCREKRALAARADELAAALEGAHQQHAAEVAALRGEVAAVQEETAAQLQRQQRALVRWLGGW